MHGAHQIMLDQLHIGDARRTVGHRGKTSIQSQDPMSIRGKPFAEMPSEKSCGACNEYSHGSMVQQAPCHSRTITAHTPPTEGRFSSGEDALDAASAITARTPRWTLRRTDCPVILSDHATFVKHHRRCTHRDDEPPHAEDSTLPPCFE